MAKNTTPQHTDAQTASHSSGDLHETATTDHPFVFPPTIEALHDWLGTTLDITLPRTAMLEGSTPPAAYIEHAFFEAGALLHPDHAGPIEPEKQPPLDCVVWANRGGGKTFLGALATMLDLIFKPGIDIRILGGSLEQSKRMLAHLHAFFTHESLAVLVDGKITQKRLRLTNGSTVEILAQSETSVRGTRVQKLRCDEVELFDPDLWEAAQLVTRSRDVTLSDGRRVEIKGAVEALSTMHRPWGLMHTIIDEHHNRSVFRWSVVDVLEACAARWQCSCCPLEAECRGRAKNPNQQGHIRIADAIQLKSRVGQACWDAEMLCQKPQRSHTVYPDFDQTIHVVGRDACWQPPAGSLIAGMDFGFRAPTVILWAIHDENDCLWVVAERVKTQTIMAQHIDALQHGPKDENDRPIGGVPSAVEWVGIDPAGRQRNDHTGISTATLMRKAGLRVYDRRMSLFEGISLVNARLKPANTTTPRLFIHARCSHLIECLERYHYPEDQPCCTTPVKDGFDHAADALRYMVQNLDKPYITRFGKY